jgi:hypothetical protein
MDRPLYSARVSGGGDYCSVAPPARHVGYAHTCKQMKTNKDINTHKHTYIHTYVYTYIHTHIRIYTYIHI